MNQGLFITFEGIEGCGKSTQIERLMQFLLDKKVAMTVTREPGGTLIGDQIRKILLNRQHSNMHPLTELLLYNAARAQHVEEVIKPSLAKGEIVLCDRYYDATLAYQGFGRNLSIDLLTELHRLATGPLTPDATFLLDCPVAVGLQRARNRENQGDEPGQDRFEQESLDFHQKIRDGYLTLAKQAPERFHIISVTDDTSIETTFEQILKHITPLLQSKGLHVG